MCCFACGNVCNVVREFVQKAVLEVTGYSFCRVRKTTHAGPKWSGPQLRGGLGFSVTGVCGGQPVCRTSGDQLLFQHLIPRCAKSRGGQSASDAPLAVLKKRGGPMA